jgi:ABC-type lipoprotein export system ATPase subunit
MIELIDVEKVYLRGAEKVKALRCITLNILPGDFWAVTGASGSGKTTLLHLIGCLDVPTKGIVKIDGIEVGHLNESELVRLRREKIGFIFQQFYLIPGLSVIENITLPLIFARKKPDKAKIIQIIETVGLKDRMHHNPNQLSGGEMQRVAIARALANNPEILLADEPTGNLDTENTERILEILLSLNSGGLTIIMVTHNPDLAGRTKSIIKLKDGGIVSSNI